MQDFFYIVLDLDDESGHNVIGHDGGKLFAGKQSATSFVVVSCKFSIGETRRSSCCCFHPRVTRSIVDSVVPCVKTTPASKRSVPQDIEPQRYVCLESSVTRTHWAGNHFNPKKMIKHSIVFLDQKLQKRQCIRQ